MTIYYIDRRTGEKKKEVVAGEGLIAWAYDTIPGKAFLESVIKRKAFSSILGLYYDLPASRRKIARFAQELEINLTEAELENPAEYKNFNHFFIRKLKEGARPINQETSHLVSPADGRILAYDNIDIHQVIQVKGQVYSLEKLLQDKPLAEQYQGGICIVVRLNPADYHRFHFPDRGIAGPAKTIPGSYYSVNPLAMKNIANVYCQNKRELTLFASENFGEIIMVEVGATCVGSIVQTYVPEQPVEKGQEKGYFKFGGSTVILFLKQGQVKVDHDILHNTQLNLETRVLMGETIGKKIIR